MTRFTKFCLLATLSFSLFPIAAQAQMNNKPFSFKNSPTGGVGMSVAAQQAIMNQHISGVTPANIKIGPTGGLLNITKGSGGIAITSVDASGEILPRYKGSGFEGGSGLLSAGVFNSYFSPSSGGGGVSTAALKSFATISTWTSRVATGNGGLSFSPSSSVDTWTAMVDSLR